MKLLRYVFLLFGLCLFNTTTPQADDHQDHVVRVYTSTFPPIVTDDPKRPGYAYEIVEEIFTIANIDFQIIQTPWARAQLEAKNRPGAVIFPLTRTPTREEKYHWAFPIFQTQTHFITINGQKLTPETARDKKIGVQLKSSWDNWLTENSYPKVHRLPEEGFGFVRMLKAGRIDTWYAEQSVARDILPRSDLNNTTFSDPVQVFDTYLATNKNAPFPHMDKLHAAFQKLKTSGRLQEIFKRYNLIQ